MADRIRYDTDEHVARAVARGLRSRGVDVLTVPEANMLGATDEEHLKSAADHKRVLFTQDDDFLRLAASGFEHAGIVYAPQQTPVGTIVAGLMLIQQILTPDEMRNPIESLNVGMAKVGGIAIELVDQFWALINTKEFPYRY